MGRRWTDLRGRSFTVVAVVALLLGCGDDAGPTEDGSVDGGGARPLPEVASPAPPVLTPCPAGWTETLLDDIPICEPWPSSGPAECSGDEMLLPGRPGCVPIGDPCPTGEFADGLPDDGSVIFVRPGATGGDGTRSAPFGTIAAALSAAPTGGTVALSKGRFDERVAINRAVTLRGACVGETELIFSATVGLDAVVSAHAEGVVVRDLTIAESPHVGFAARMGSDAELRSVLVEGALEIGVIVTGGRLVADRVAVRGTRTSARGFGRGVDVEGGGTLEATAISIVGSADRGAFAAQMGSRLSLTDFVVRDTAPAIDGTDGWGVHADVSSTVELAEGVVEESHEGAVAVFQRATLTARDVVIRDTLGRGSDRAFGCGVAAENEGVLTLSRALVQRVRDAGIVISTGAEMSLTDVVVADVAPQESDGLLGRGITAQRGASASIERAAIRRAHNIAFFVVEPETNVTATDVSIHDTLPGARDETGWGLFMRDTATLDVERLEIVGSRDLGLHVITEGTTLTARDVAVRDTRARLSDGAFGRAVDIERGPSAMIERAIVEDAHNAGVFVGAPGTDVTLRDVAVLDVAPSPCSMAGCAEIANGIVSTAGATLRVDDFSVARATVCGVHVANMASLDLADGDVSESQIGACVSVPDYDIARLTAEVRYRDNGTSLDTSGSLPVPEPSPSIED